MDLNAIMSVIANNGNKQASGYLSPIDELHVSFGSPRVYTYELESPITVSDANSESDSSEEEDDDDSEEDEDDEDVRDRRAGEAKSFMESLLERQAELNRLKL
jgi:hypothetical protein